MDLMNTEQRNTGQSRFEQLVARLERVERPLEVSDRVAQVFLNNEYVFPVESGTPERALTRWLALVDSSWRSSRRNGPTSYPEELIDCRDGEVADELSPRSLSGSGFGRRSDAIRSRLKSSLRQR
jgi:hypothetical protein